MITRIFRSASVSLLFLSPAAAQFGMPNGRKKAASFQELNEQAKRLQEEGAGAGGIPGLGNMADLQKMYGEMMNDPEAIKQMEAFSGQMKDAVDLIAKMTPEQLEKQMQDAMEMLKSGDMMKTMMETMDKDQIIKTLEAYGMIPKEEIEKFKTDPEYLDQKMAESLDQMSELFNDPEVLKAATNAVTGMKDLYENPEKIAKMAEEVLGDFDSDEKIEEARQLLLKNLELGYPGMKEAFETEEMKEILNDPVKWRESVKEGQGILKAADKSETLEGAGVGEL